jgi:hypothetical protein
MSQITINDLPMEMHQLIVNDLDWIRIRSLNTYWKILMDDIETKRDNVIIVTKISILNLLDKLPNTYSFLYSCKNGFGVNFLRKINKNNYKLCNCMNDACICYNMQLQYCYFNKILKESHDISNRYKLKNNIQYSIIAPGYEFIENMIKNHPLSNFNVNQTTSNNNNNENFIKHKIYTTIIHYFNLVEHLIPH